MSLKCSIDGPRHLLFDPTDCYGRGANDCQCYQQKIKDHLASGGKGFNLPIRSKIINNKTKLCEKCNDFVETCQGLLYANHTSSTNKIHKGRCCRACNNLDESLKALLKNKNRVKKLEAEVMILKEKGQLVFRDGKSTMMLVLRLASQ